MFVIQSGDRHSMLTKQDHEKEKNSVRTLKKKRIYKVANLTLLFPIVFSIPVPLSYMYA
jgi:hypothetical protein